MQYKNPPEPVGFLFLGAWLAAILALILRRFVTFARGALALVMILGFVVAGLAGLGLGAAAWYRENAAYAVVVSPVAPVREGPADDFKTAFEVHEGLKVKVVSSERGYRRIRLPNGVEGWVRAADVPAI